MRIETDFLGTMELPEDALYGIHSQRAARNFPDTTRFHAEWYQSMGTVKRACLLTYSQFADAVREKYPAGHPTLKLTGREILDALITAAGEVENNLHFSQFIVPAVQGGAGTSINMNVNEIIANRALQLTGHKPGDYACIDPIEQVNIFQSTNDVVPTSLKIALLRQLGLLEETINQLRKSVEEKEKQSRSVLRIGYTQMQEAVPTSYGRLFSTYADALSRDWWRVSKCFERLKPVNLGGSAIGTGITVPRYFLTHVVQTLQEITGLPVTRSENLQDATANQDALVEVHAILKAHAVNLEKMVSDIRLLASDLTKSREISIPRLQVGSSIMPAKVNPVVPEFVISAAHKVYSNDLLTGSLCAMGCLDLNAYLPVIGHALIESLKLLIACDETLTHNLVNGLEINEEASAQNLFFSPAITTALLPYIGYHRAAQLARLMKEKNINITEANREINLISEKELARILSTEHLLQEGFSLQDILIENGERKGE